MHRTRVRRRRTAAAALLLSVVLVGGSPVARAFGGSDGERDRATYVVRSGDTLWSIAERHAPGDDPRVVIHEIAVWNDLGDAPLVPGQPLLVPVG